MIELLHKTVMGTLRRLPLPAARLGFRAYNKALRTLGPEHLATTYFGARLYCNPQDLIQRMILYFGVWEPDVSRVIEQNLSAGDVFVDIGAKHRLRHAPRLLPRRRHRQGRFDRSLAAHLRAPATQPRGQPVFVERARCQCRRVRQAGTLDLYEINEGNIGAATTLASRGGTLMASVEALPLAEILKPDELARLRLIKMDVEGAEPPILRHLLEQLSRYPRRWTSWSRRAPKTISRPGATSSTGCVPRASPPGPSRTTTNSTGTALAAPRDAAARRDHAGAPAGSPVHATPHQPARLNHARQDGLAQDPQRRHPLVGRVVVAGRHGDQQVHAGKTQRRCPPLP